MQAFLNQIRTGCGQHSILIRRTLDFTLYRSTSCCILVDYPYSWFQEKKTYGSIFLATMMMTINTEKDIEGSKVKKGISLHMDVTYYKNYSENMH